MIEQEVLAQEYGHVVLISREHRSDEEPQGGPRNFETVHRAILSCSYVQETPDHLRIVVETGNSVAIIFFGEAALAGLSAQYLFETLQVDADRQLRIVCHSDMIKRQRASRGRWVVSGRGIEKARKILDWCDGTSVVCSETFVENLRPWSDHSS
jgi:hypothetical protein